MFALERPRRARRPGLTPMIDVVFLLLVFFMLAARFGLEGAVALTAGGGAGDWSGPPRLVEVAPDALRLNGVERTPQALRTELARLTDAPSDPVLLRARDGATLQHVVDAMDALRAGGYTRLMLVE